jgi:hypothetical protein
MIYLILPQLVFYTLGSVLLALILWGVLKSVFREPEPLAVKVQGTLLRETYAAATSSYPAWLYLVIPALILFFSLSALYREAFKEE